MHTASIVIPASNEERVIDRCLEAVCDPRFKVIVATNGCADQTAVRARRHNATVIELSERSKIAALNAADQAAGDLFPRIYLDADIVLSSAHARLLADYLSYTSDPIVAAPRIEFETAHSSAMVKAFYRVYRQLPYIATGMVGSGCFAVNAAGRSRWHQFPHVTADDLFVQGLFSMDERRVLDAASFVVQAPRTIRALSAVRTRTYLGNSELQSNGIDGSMAGSRRQSLQELSRLVVAQPARVLDAMTYLAINTSASWRAGRRSIGSEWLTDASTR